MTVEDFSPEAVVEELLDGDGAIRVPGVYTADQVARAKAIVEAATADHALTGSHFNQDEAGARLQRRVWNLFAVDPVFCDMIEHHVTEEEQPGGMFSEASESEDMDLDALGEQIAARKAELESTFIPGGEPPTSVGRGDERPEQSM